VLFISLFLTKALKNALSGPTQNCSWDQRRVYASGVSLPVPFVEQFFFPLRSAAEQKVLVVWKQEASCRKTSKQNVSRVGNLPSHPSLVQLSLSRSSSVVPWPSPTANPQLIAGPLLCSGHGASSCSTSLSLSFCCAPAQLPSTSGMCGTVVCLPPWRSLNPRMVHGWKGP